MPGERFVVCSDGLSLELSDDEIAAVLRAEPTAQGAADLLVHSAVLAGGRDNVTAVVVDHLTTAGTDTGSFTRGAHAAPEDEDTDPGIVVYPGIDTDPLGIPVPARTGTDTRPRAGHPPGGAGQGTAPAGSGLLDVVDVPGGLDPAGHLQFREDAAHVGVTGPLREPDTTPDVRARR